MKYVSEVRRMGIVVRTRDNLLPPCKGNIKTEQMSEL
jgi:hypothetical protein